MTHLTGSTLSWYYATQFIGFMLALLSAGPNAFVMVDDIIDVQFKHLQQHFDVH
jgi:hypothetical protein